MIIQRRFAPIGGRFEPEQVAAFTGIYILGIERAKMVKFDRPQCTFRRPLNCPDKGIHFNHCHIQRLSYKSWMCHGYSRY